MSVMSPIPSLNQPYGPKPPLQPPLPNKVPQQAMQAQASMQPTPGGMPNSGAMQQTGQDSSHFPPGYLPPVTVAGADPTPHNPKWWNPLNWGWKGWTVAAGLTAVYVAIYKNWDKLTNKAVKK